MFGKDPEATGRKNIVVIRVKREQELSAPAVQGGREITSIERCGMMRSTEVLRCGVWACKMWRVSNLCPSHINHVW